MEGRAVLETGDRTPAMVDQLADQGGFVSGPDQHVGVSAVAWPVLLSIVPVGQARINRWPLDVQHIDAGLITDELHRGVPKVRSDIGWHRSFGAHVSPRSLTSPTLTDVVASGPMIIGHG